MLIVDGARRKYKINWIRDSLVKRAETQSGEELANSLTFKDTCVVHTATLTSVLETDIIRQQKQTFTLSRQTMDVSATIISAAMEKIRCDQQ